MKLPTLGIYGHHPLPETSLVSLHAMFTLDKMREMANLSCHIRVDRMEVDFEASFKRFYEKARLADAYPSLLWEPSVGRVPIHKYLSLPGDDAQYQLDHPYPLSVLLTPPDISWDTDDSRKIKLPSGGLPIRIQHKVSGKELGRGTDYSVDLDNDTVLLNRGLSKADYIIERMVSFTEMSKEDLIVKYNELSAPTPTRDLFNVWNTKIKQKEN